MSTFFPEEPTDHCTSCFWPTFDISERSRHWAEQVWIKSQEVICIGYLWTLKWSVLSTLSHLAHEEDSRPGSGLLWFKCPVSTGQVKVVTFDSWVKSDHLRHATLGSGFLGHETGHEEVTPTTWDRIKRQENLSHLRCLSNTLLILFC